MELVKSMAREGKVVETLDLGRDLETEIHKVIRLSKRATVFPGLTHENIRSGFPQIRASTDWFLASFHLRNPESAGQLRTIRSTASFHAKALLFSSLTLRRTARPQTPFAGH